MSGAVHSFIGILVAASMVSACSSATRRSDSRSAVPTATIAAAALSGPTAALYATPAIESSPSRCVVPPPRAVPLALAAPRTCEPPPPGIAEAVTAAITKAVRADAGRDAKVRVSFPCSPLTSPPVRVWSLRVWGHGGSTTLLGLRRDGEGKYAATGMRVRLRDDGPADVEMLEQGLVVGAGEGSLLSLQAGLTAAIDVTVPDGKRGKLELAPIKVTSANVLQKAHVDDGKGGVLGRSFAGYPGSDQPDRIATDVVWSLLERVVPQRFEKRPVTDEDRRLLVGAWGESILPWYAEAPMAALAGAAGSPAVLARIVALLDSPRPQVRALAVDAIATISGWDIRKGSDGRPRPLEDVVRDYRRECRR